MRSVVGGRWSVRLRVPVAPRARQFTTSNVTQRPDEMSQMRGWPTPRIRRWAMPLAEPH